MWQLHSCAIMSCHHPESWTNFSWGFNTGGSLTAEPGSIWVNSVEMWRMFLSVSNWSSTFFSKVCSFSAFGFLISSDFLVYDNIFTVCHKFFFRRILWNFPDINNQYWGQLAWMMLEQGSFWDWDWGPWKGERPPGRFFFLLDFSNPLGSMELFSPPENKLFGGNPQKNGALEYVN